jgi:ribosome maturation factor RimP
LESILKSPLEERLLALCETVLGPQGFRTVDLDCRVGSRSLLRIFIERSAEGAGAPPTLDDCASASRLIGAALDAEPEMIPSAYDLEVSSPGLDRRLRLHADFEKAVGQDIRLKLTESVPGLGANVTGVLAGVGEKELVVNVNKKDWALALSKVRQANIIWRS